MRLVVVGLGVGLGMSLLWGASASAAVLDDDNVLSLSLRDGTVVRLYGEAGPGGQKTQRYHYLPANLRLARRPDKTPEFLFLKYTTEQRESDRGVQGALLHFLVEWGLDGAQEAELEERLQGARRGAQLIGPVRMEPVAESAGFQIVSATLSDSSLTPQVLHFGKAPLLPGDRAAAAARLSGRGAQLMAASLEQTRSIVDLSVQLNFRYTTLAPAARGTATIHWDRLVDESESLKSEYTKTKDCFLWWCGEAEISYEESRTQFQFLESKKVVEVDFEELREDERTAKIREAFFQYFLDALATPSLQAPPAPAAQGDDGEESADQRRQGKSNSFSQTVSKTLRERGSQTFRLEYRMAVRWPFSLTGNLGEWYDGVRDNPRCVGAVNLNDPFFQHRDLQFVLDLDSREMFEDAVNYVTVNVRKTRSSGRPFEDSLTFTAESVAASGVVQSLTYARGEDAADDVYEYQEQWSLRGGEVFPAKPPWRSGSWEGVTLTPPVASRAIELEGDLSALKAAGVTRVTAQIRYRRFGREVEENLHLSPLSGEPLVRGRIYLDRGSRGYAYRLILNHKELGKLALPWSPKVGDDYIYAAIPADLLADSSSSSAPSLVAARQAAKQVPPTGDEGVLAQFAELLEGEQR